MERRDNPSLTDYLLVGINPFLIMLLVGSLVFFLLEALYQGQYDGRLKLIFALFVMAIVCISRISINEGKGHATLFAIPLALVTALAMSRFVEYSGSFAGFKTFLNWGLMGIVWWAAHQLTWDCTVIDEAADASGQGLFQQLGWRKEAVTEPTSRSAIDEPEGLTSHDEPAAPVEGVWTKLRQRLLRKHTPGVWVVYFSLAALPIFGFGQGFIGGQDADGQSRAQRYLAVYVGSGLALLVSTSFLNLRRYLRKRQVEISQQLTVNWLVAGAALILAVLAVSWILPGPGAASWANPIAFSRNLNPSKWGFGEGTESLQSGSLQSGGQKSGGQQPGNLQSGGQKSGGQKSGGQQPGGQQPGGQQPGGQQPSGQQPGGQQPGGQQPGGLQPGGQQPTGQQPGGQQPSGQQPGGQQPGGQQPGGQQPQPDKSGKAQSGAPSNPPSNPPSNSSGSGQSGQSSDSKPAESNSSGSGTSGSSLSSIAESTATALTWLVRIAALVAIVFALWLFRASILPGIRSFLEGLRNWFAGLFGGTPRHTATSEPDDAKVTLTPPPAWREFVNPFATGNATRVPAGELIRYTFAALDAWARENGHARGIQETPLEFARRLSVLDEQFGREAQAVAEYYGQVAFAREALPVQAVAAAQKLWQRLLVSPASAATV